MDQFQHLGEAFGSLQALMVFRDEIQINRNQCLFLFHILRRAFHVVSTEIRQNLRLLVNSKTHLKWTALEHPLLQLVGIFRGAEKYIAHCIQSGTDWYAKAISLKYDNDVVEHHVYSLLWCLPVVIEALESLTEDMYRKNILASNKYDKEWLDPKLFQVRFGKHYLVSADIVGRVEMVCKEDRWNLMEMIQEKKKNTNKEQRLVEVLTGPRGSLFPTASLLGSKDYRVKRRLGNGSHLKEIQWRGESFVVRHIFGDIKPLVPEIKQLSSLSHPNIMNIFCAFSDEDRKECFLLMELMNKDLRNYIKENTSSRRKHLFSLPVAVDLMLQIGRGMEYLHSHQIPHGNLNPSTVLVKPTTTSVEGLHVKITGFGVSPLMTSFNKNSTNNHQMIWCAPEVVSQGKTSEKADVYSFGMLCFELITGKVPFEGDPTKSISRNIRSGERPLFPLPSPPKCLTNLTRQCWKTEPSQRPSFPTICRILRYIKRFLLLNPNHSRPYAPVPVVDYHDLESSLCRRFPSWANTSSTVTQVPFEMFSYKVTEMEMEKINLNCKDGRSSSDSGNDDDSSGTSCASIPPVFRSPSRSPSPRPTSESPEKKPVHAKKLQVVGNGKQKKWTGTSTTCVRRLGTRTHSDGQLPPLSRLSVSPQERRRMSGHVSDSELCSRC